MTSTKYYNVYGFRQSGARTPDQVMGNRRQAERTARDLVRREGCVSGWVFRWTADECRNVYHYQERG